MGDFRFDEVYESCQKWLESMETCKDHFRMSKNSYDDHLFDSISLSYDLTHMLNIDLSEVQKDDRKVILDSYQDDNVGFYHEKDSDIRLDITGVNRIKEMHGNYLTFQAVGAYEAINRFPGNRVTFYDGFIKENGIYEYLSSNCPWLVSPWGAGGMVDNLGTILGCNVEMGYKIYQEALEEVFRWLSDYQSPDTGLWGSTEIQGINGVVNGGYHLMRGTYFKLGRPFDYARKIIDLVLEDLRANDIFKANRAHGCQDLDHFFLLDKCYALENDYRADEICSITEKRLSQIMKSSYCIDGGFSFEADNAVKNHNYYKVTPGVKESDMQGTVFYLQTIKSISRILKFEVKWNDSKTHG